MILKWTKILAMRMKKANLHHPLKMTITCLQMKGPAPSPKQKKIKKRNQVRSHKENKLFKSRTIPSHRSPSKLELTQNHAYGLSATSNNDIGFQHYIWMSTIVAWLLHSHMFHSTIHNLSITTKSKQKEALKSSKETTTDAGFQIPTITAIEWMPDRSLLIINKKNEIKQHLLVVLLILIRLRALNFLQYTRYPVIIISLSSSWALH